MRDLTDPKWIHLKAAMFLVIGIVSAGLILATVPNLQVAVLLGLAIWSFCRAYYFAFYVIEKYLDPSFRFSGLWSAGLYLISENRKNSPRCHPKN